MKALSLRTSLLAWFVGLTSLVMGAASLALYLGVRESLLDGIDAELRARAEGVAALVEWEHGGPHLEGAIETSASVPLFADGHAIEIRQLPGMALVRSSGLELPPMASPPATGLSTLPGDLRAFVMVLDFPAYAGSSQEDRQAHPAFSVVVRVATSLLSMRAQLDRITWVILLVGVASIVAVVAFGAFLSRRVTVPLEMLGDAAIRVRDGIESRMPTRGTGDEIDRLAELLDQSFAALRESIDRQKRFIADASHELRNPIAILQSTTEIALRRRRDVCAYEATLREVQDVARRMTSLIESLLTLARIDNTDEVARERIEVVDVVRQEVAAVGGVAGKTVDVEGASAAHVWGDRHLLAILVGNLLANALRHAAHEVRVQVRCSGASVEVRVADDGQGVPAAERPKLFERFFRGEGSHGHTGAGLGLALVAAIAEAHGGSCRLDESIVGLALIVQLPAADG